MVPVTRAQRIYFAFVGAFALWVGVWGYFFPAEIARAIPWQVPALHARFIGAMYLSGMALMGLALIARHLAEVRIALMMAAIWTGMLLLVSLLHLTEFDYSHPPVWFWFGAYIVYPLVGARLYFAHRPGRATGRRVPEWVHRYLIVQGAICTALALLLLFAPGSMVEIWPWRISPLLTQIYAGPFLSYGVGSLLLARRRTWTELYAALSSMFAFAALVLIASWIHMVVFGAIGAAALIWFGGFAIATVMLAYLSYLAWRGKA
jgi:hypothetical protein